MPLASVPNDPLLFMQWDMTQIDAPAGWSLSTGTGVIVAILDTGVDQTHPDLNLASPGINLATMLSPGSPIASWGADMGHGTCCSGLAAARINNSVGVAGVAGNARILPLASPTLSNVEVAAGINFAAATGARVISMSFTIPPNGLVNNAIANAVNVRGLVLCAATGNNNSGVANGYPATNPLVIACGGSDESDNRKRPVRLEFVVRPSLGAGPDPDSGRPNAHGSARHGPACVRRQRSTACGPARTRGCVPRCSRP
jgi:subtilisin family serine protease